MRKKLYTFILLLLIVTTDIALGKNGNKHKAQKSNNKKQKHKEKIIGERTKRSLYDDDKEPFWPNRGKKLAETINYVTDNHLAEKGNDLIKYPPFWEARGRRESSSFETNNDSDYIDEYENLNKCIKRLNTEHKYLKGRRDDISPFWGNRGRRHEDDSNLFEPFWGSRGRRQENEPFWGNRGKKEDEPFWGNRGKKEDEPFWGNRGKKKMITFWGNGGQQDDEPFWGNRGKKEFDLGWGNRHQQDEPFWGTRGKKEFDPFWGNRGRKSEPEEDDPFWGNRGRRNSIEILDKVKQKEQLKRIIFNAINDIENDVDQLSRLRRSSNTYFWMNRGRDSTLKTLFNSPRIRLSEAYASNLKPPEASTVRDSRIFADEPHYILVDRSSRSSGEEDPFFVSRGKKYYLNYNLIKAARDRRGALEEIVKSVRNDPYYIARGKKDDVKNDNITKDAEYLKAKELICSVIDLITVKDKNTKTKRETDENDRNRRTILNKLAAQLQMDPYFVSRGKKNETNNKSYLTEFINDMADKCN